MTNRFLEATKQLPIHKEGEWESVYRSGYKMTRNTKTNEIRILATYKDHKEIPSGSILYGWFLNTEFKYLSDMLSLKRNYNKLYKVEYNRIKKNTKDEAYEEAKELYRNRILTLLKSISDYEFKKRQN